MRLSRRTAIGGALAAGAAMTVGGTASAQPGERHTASGRVYELRHGDQHAVIAGVAATLLSYRAGGEELLLTHPADEMGEGYQGKTILPWPNRIDHGRYTFGGVEHQVPINEIERDTALHGLLSFTEWEPVRHERDHVVLRIRQYPHYGYPFELAFQIEFSLGPDGLRSTLTARNTGDSPAPFGTANHTYVRAASGTIDSMELELGADTHYLVNDRLIPTGTAPVAGTPYDFRTRRRIGDTLMDTAFTGLRRNARGVASVHFGRPGGRNVEMWMDRGYGYLQVYTDDGPDGHPPRSGITVEPVSCAPNCFNTGDGLVVLEPGERWRGSFGYRTMGA
ncbi:aldose 1-epimerase [Herbihabitans rhizosphaerae]|uniref:Aldose 1-epimerase n=1 Tax=Herbihabitans rhizosphaerae TaxID=1872711 RepID=A0A4V2ERK5_9PSEU|nr:aldose 1-epimerase family protein [Herbihabitans rhizosphaerae]RZS32269.1 aldose 1-epimerase [Herbihabitans rhizosphaerae]